MTDAAVEHDDQTHAQTDPTAAVPDDLAQPPAGADDGGPKLYQRPGMDAIIAARRAALAEEVPAQDEPEGDAGDGGGDDPDPAAPPAPKPKRYAEVEDDALVRLTADGTEIEIPFGEIRKGAQQLGTAQSRLNEAARRQKELDDRERAIQERERALQQGAARSDTGQDDTPRREMPSAAQDAVDRARAAGVDEGMIGNIVDQLQYGSREDALAAVKTLVDLSRSQSPGRVDATPGDVQRVVAEEIARNEAAASMRAGIETLKTDYPDLVTDPTRAQITAGFFQSVVDQDAANGIQRSNRDRVIEAARISRTWFEQQAAQYRPAGQQPDPRLVRKQALPMQPTTAATRMPLSPDARAEPHDRSAIVAQMRRARGQSA